MWSEEVLMVELVKSDRGLGFSILDYQVFIRLIKSNYYFLIVNFHFQDPMSKDETVIVIRSLVPGGVAAWDGRILPGDRLMFVNDVNLSHASLDEAVQVCQENLKIEMRGCCLIEVMISFSQALKGAPKGIVRIGVSKPIPNPDNSTTTISQGTNSSADDNTEVRSEVSDMEHDTASPSHRSTAGCDDIPPPIPTRFDINSQFLAFIILKINSPFLFHSPLPDDDDHQERVIMSPEKLEEHTISRQTISLPAAERLIGGPTPGSQVVRIEEKR